MSTVGQGQVIFNLPANELREKPLVVFADKMIGKGTFGQVYKIKYNGKDAALKIVPNTNPGSTDIINQEVRMLKSISEKYPKCVNNILCYYDISQDKNNIYFVSELLDMDYFDVITDDKYCESSNGDKIAFTYDSLKQMLSGLKTLHSIGIIHRDIKPENFLVKWNNPKVIKVADFGFSCYYSNQNKQNDCTGRLGTPIYLSPHIILDENDPVWSVMDDLYSLACVVYSSLTCISFVDDDTIGEFLSQMISGKLDKKYIEEWYNANFIQKIQMLDQMYSDKSGLSDKQFEKYEFLRAFCFILLDPKSEQIYQADTLLRNMLIE